MYGIIMEETDVRCCDTAALVALINMLKVNLGSTPEIYNTLLAVLCDFDPSNHGNRDRTVRYIRQLVSDKVLANCLLMSLPHGGHRYQNLPSFSNSLPDMKKAIRHKFLGMKLSVQAKQPRSGEHTDKHADSNLTNQNITIIVTDQEETGSNSLHNSYNRSLLQSQSQSSSDPLRTCTTASCDSKMSSSQTKCIITFTKSSSGSLSKNTPTSPQASANDNNVVSDAAQSSQNVAVVKPGSGSQTNISKVRDNSGKESEDPSVENRSTITLMQSHGAKGILSQCYKQARINHISPCPVSLQNLSQTEKNNIYSNPQARLPSAIIPLPYQQFTNPVQGNTSYRHCFTGTAINPLFPWTPIHYIPGIMPSHNLGSVGYYTRHSSVSSVEDVSVDLSLPRTSTSAAQNAPAESKDSNKTFNGTRQAAKRCASTTFTPSRHEEPKQKVQRLSADIPIYPNTRYIEPDKSENINSERLPTSRAASYLCLLENRDGKDERHPNSLQALQELTSRINPKPNPLTVRKSLSTGSFPETRRSRSVDIQKDSDAGEKFTVKSCERNRQNQNEYVAKTQSTTQKLLFANKDFTASLKPKTNLSLTTPSTQYHLASPTERKESVLPHCVQEKLKCLQGKQRPSEQNAAFTQFHKSCISEAVPDISSTTCTSDGNVIPSDTHEYRTSCLRNFPYTQHIQLPDGKCSVIDFAALAKSNTLSCEQSLSTGKDYAKVQKPSRFGCPSGINLENAKTLVDKQVSDIDCSVSDYPGKYSLKRHDTSCSDQSVEKEDSRSAIPPEELGNPGEETDPESTNKTCLIIETTTENGTEQVQFQLDKQSSASLLGELLKLKPVQHNSACAQTGVLDVTNSSNNISQMNMTTLNNNGQGIDGNIANTRNGHSRNENDSVSEPDMSFSSFNVSPYLLGMLPDTTTFSENYDDSDNEEDYEDDLEKEESDSDEDDDVFLHPIF